MRGPELVCWTPQGAPKEALPGDTRNQYFADHGGPGVSGHVYCGYELCLTRRSLPLYGILLATTCDRMMAARCSINDQQQECTNILLGLLVGSVMGIVSIYLDLTQRESTVPRWMEMMEAVPENRFMLC